MESLLAKFLVILVLLGSALASPAMMAHSTQPSVQPYQTDTCTLFYNESPNGLEQASAATSCSASACAMFVSIANLGLQPTKPLPALLVSALRNHSGRLLEGPDPFPPRYSNI